MSGAYPDGMDAGESLPAPVPRHDPGDDETAGDDGRRRRDRGTHVADGLRGPRRRAGAARQAVFVMHDQAAPRSRYPFETVDKLLFCADKGVPSTYCPSPSPADGADHDAGPDQLASPRRCSASSCTSCGRLGPRSSSARAPTHSTWQRRSPRTIRRSSSAPTRWSARWRSGWTSPTGASADTRIRRSSTPKPAWRPTRSPSSPCSWAPTSTTTSAHWTSASSGSLAEVVLVAEFISRNRQLLKAIEVDDETLAVDVLKAVGPGGEFLGQRHTRKHLREEPVARQGPEPRQLRSLVRERRDRRHREVAPAGARAAGDARGRAAAGRPRRAARRGGAGWLTG